MGAVAVAPAALLRAPALAVAGPAHHHQAVVAAPGDPSPMDLSTLPSILLVLDLLLLVFLPPPLQLLLLLSTVLLLLLLLVLAALLVLVLVLVLLLLGLQPLLPPRPSTAAPFSAGAASPRRGRSLDSSCCRWRGDLGPGIVRLGKHEGGLDLLSLASVATSEQHPSWPQRERRAADSPGVICRLARSHLRAGVQRKGWRLYLLLCVRDG